MGIIAVGSAAGSALPSLLYRNAPVGHCSTVAMICSTSPPSRLTHERFFKSNTECKLRRQIPVWTQRVESQKTAKPPFS